MKLKAKKKRDPAFVINVTAYVSSDSETSASEDSDDDEEFKFFEKDFNSPPYSIQTNQRGVVEPEIVIDNVDVLPEAYSSKVIKPLLEKLEDEGYADSEDNGSDRAKKNLSVSFGLNRPRSLSKGKNKVLFKELAVPIDSEIRHQKFASFWGYPWARRSNVAVEDRNCAVTYREVRSFYKQLKARDPDAAREFRHSQENQPRNSMVPYRDLRERTKNHNATRTLVIDARAKHPGGDIYLSFIDSDTQSFSYNGHGIYRNYVQLHKQYQAPEVMSTGYEFLCDKMPMLTLACSLDRAVRAATAKFIALGIYYPEPNFLIKILDGKDTVEESFYEITPSGRVSKKSYASPQEAPLILEKVAKRPNANRPHGFIFFNTNPTLIKTPHRATQNKAKKDFQFDGELNEDQQFVNWSEQDLMNMANVAQSHIGSRNWATNLLNAIVLNDEARIDNIVIKDGAEIRRLTISLLSRLYHVYDPLELCEKFELPEGGYQALLHYVLINYDEQIDGSVDSVNRPKKTKPLPQEKKVRKHHKNTKKEIAAVWAYVDAINNLQNLKDVLQILVSGEDVNRIEHAAKASGEAIVSTLLEHLEFPVEHNDELGL